MARSGFVHARELARARSLGAARQRSGGRVVRARGVAAGSETKARRANMTCSGGRQANGRRPATLLLVLWFAVILAGLLALAPLLRLCGGSSRARLAAVCAGTAGVVSVTLCTVYAPAPARARADRPLEVLDAGHVGSATCRSCHPGEHASWHGSFHRTMTQKATRANVVPEFDRLELDWFGEPVVLEWRGDELWTQFVRGGGRPGPVERPIAQLTGSHHMQVFWYTTGAGRELAPVPDC